MFLLSRDDVPLAVSADRASLRRYSAATAVDRWTSLGADHEISDEGYEIFPIPSL